MNLEIYSEFLKTIGKKVIPGDGYLWCQVGGGFYHCFPVHQPIHPSKQQLTKVFWGGPAIGVRFSTDAMTNGGKASFVYLCEKGAYGLDLLSANQRSKVRRGLKHCQVGQITEAEYFCSQGWSLHAETLKRQGRLAKADRRNWKRTANCLGHFAGLEVWGAWFEEALAAFVLTFQVEDCVHLLTFRSADQYLRYYPNNALIYTVISEMLSREAVRLVSFGEESLQGLESLDAFKTGMGFRKQPMVQKIILNPFVSPAVNGLTKQLICTMNKRNPQSVFWRKALGVVELL
ncbi:MAG: hypothetical protein ONB44_05900 [candidate division KSB1 bacterium]|nr:hypothetical protein [candidate division KSB1 bacterium]MDZ7301660.1 hypothetical protein [candidate division KSB1 bacterium]MDZ7313479.1 hypothetical protein [candidate division KSB1 bacterium]